MNVPQKTIGNTLGELRAALGISRRHPQGRDHEVYCGNIPGSPPLRVRCSGDPHTVLRSLRWAGRPPRTPLEPPMTGEHQ